MTGATGVRVRDAEPADLEAITGIYAHHVRHGLASFEEVPPDRAEMEQRFRAARDAGTPYLAGELGLDGVQGYAYALPYHRRPGYRYSVENSVYVGPDALGKGLGAALLEDLIRRCTALGYRQMIAIIGDSGNAPSIRLHESKGFQHIGTVADVGFKFGRWVDSVMMQRPLGDGATTLPDRPPGRTAGRTAGHPPGKASNPPGV